MATYAICARPHIYWNHSLFIDFAGGRRIVATTLSPFRNVSVNIFHRGCFASFSLFLYFKYFQITPSGWMLIHQRNCNVWCEYACMCRWYGWLNNMASARMSSVCISMNDTITTAACSHTDGLHRQTVLVSSESVKRIPLIWVQFCASSVLFLHFHCSTCSFCFNFHCTRIEIRG